MRAQAQKEAIQRRRGRRGIAGDIKIQTKVTSKDYEAFRKAIYPLSPNDAIRSYIRIVISSQETTLQEVIDKGLEELVRKR